MEARETNPVQSTSNPQARDKDSQAIPDGVKLLLAPLGRRNKMRIEGHRGMGRYEPENTLQAFARAVDEELDGVELDVWLTKDKVPIVIHSQVVDGAGGYVTFDDGSQKQVTGMTVSEVRSLKVLKGHIIPLLDEVFRIAKDKVCVNVEFKGEDLNGAMEVLKLCKAHKNLDQVQFSSFNWKFAEALDTARKTLNIETRPPFGFLTMKLDVLEAFSIGKPGDGVTFGWDLIEDSKEEFKAIVKEINNKKFYAKIYFPFAHKEIYEDYDYLEAAEIDTVITNEPFLMKRYYQQKSTKTVTV